MPYPNGQVPLDKLVHLGGLIYLPPGTAARWLWVVAEGKRRWGVTFYITPASARGWDGWNGYRPLDAQKKYRNAFGQMAAVPGYSSHGGFYGGQEVFAIDVANWGAVTWSRFSGLMAEAGLRTNFVNPEERWHVGDFNNPWVIDPKFGDDMSVEDIYNARDADGRNVLDLGRQTRADIDNLRSAVNELIGKVPANVWAHPIQAQNEKGQPLTNPDGSPLRYSASGYLPSTNAQVGVILSRGGISDAQVKVVADAVIKAIGAPTVSVDYDKIGKTVREAFRADPLK